MERKEDEEPRMNVKITVYGLGDMKSHAEEVVYFRYRLTLDMAVKWRWYFEYLAARVKVRNPKRKVELIITRQTCPCGLDYVAEKSKTLLRSKRGQLKHLENEVFLDDLFSFEGDRRKEKIKILQQEITWLEAGEFHYYIPPTYINKLWKWI